MSEFNENEAIEFNVEDGTADTEDLRAKDYKKFRELYKLLMQIGSYNGTDREDSEDVEKFNILRSNELYPEAIKSPFFIEKLAQRYKKGGFDKNITEKLLEDLDALEDGNSSKYYELRKQIMNREVAKNNIKFDYDMIIVLILAILSFVCMVLFGVAFNESRLLGRISNVSTVMFWVFVAYLTVRRFYKTMEKIFRYRGSKSDK
ncbi:MAG: hypothetical protein J5856_04675 [Lachnospiraceae bacterium]|nr:hypothetical protein [Lachnospiraceae bacterium]